MNKTGSGAVHPSPLLHLPSIVKIKEDHYYPLFDIGRKTLIQMRFLSIFIHIECEYHFSMTAMNIFFLRLTTSTLVAYVNWEKIKYHLLYNCLFHDTPVREQFFQFKLISSFDRPAVLKLCRTVLINLIKFDSR